MEQGKEERIFQYLQEYTRGVDLRAKEFLYDLSGSLKPQREIFGKLKSHIDKFLKQKSELRSFIMPGLRGTGKTTLLYQLYKESFDTEKSFKKLFLSVDHITSFLDASIFEVLSVYEKLIGVQLEELQEPLVIFLDEVQYDIKWDISLKNIYDRTNKVFVIATGSSALGLQNSPDLARRAIFEKILPLSFTEYIEIKEGIKFDKAISQNISNALLESESAKDLLASLEKQEQYIRDYFMQTTQFDIDRYLNYGSLPFTLSIDNTAVIYQQIKTLVDRIINIDLKQLDSFNNESIAKVPALLYAIADYDQLSHRKLSELFGISHPTLGDLLDILSKTELLTRVYPYGSHNSQVKKSSKYLFSSPAFRSMYFNFIANIKGDYIGKILEDTIAMYLNRILGQNIDYSFTYDSAEKGADFIIGHGDNFILCEVGSSKKSFTQLNQTLKKIPEAKYGFNISKSLGVNGLKISQEEKFINLPIEYFLVC